MKSRLSKALLSVAIGVAALSAGPIQATAGQKTPDVAAKNAEALFKAMSDYLGKQDKLSYAFDSNLEIVTKEGQKLGLTSSGKLSMSRDQGIRASRLGGFADVEMVFDGNSIALLDKELNRYATSQIPGSIENLIEVLRFKFKKPLPAADFLRRDVYGYFKASITDFKDLGSGYIRGQECDHIAMRAAFVDMELWIAQGSRPYPCKITITSTDIDRAPQYTIDIRDFKAGKEVEAVDYRFVAPKDAVLVTPQELGDFDELPTIFKGKILGGAR